jgi:hypothetical protein
MIIKQEGMRYTYNGMTYTVGSAVMATEASGYRGLYGTITEIRDGADRETENDTSDIYCCFEPPFLPKEIQKLERRFTELYQSPKKLDEITLDMVIMAPEIVRVISPDPSVCKTCKVYLLTMQFTTSWDSGCITELYADYDMARFAMLKGIREEQAEGCVKDWAEKDALEEEYCTDFYEAWHRDEYSEKHFTASIEKLSLTLAQRIIEAE